MTVSEMVQALNKASQTKPVRILLRGNGINTQDVVLYVMPDQDCNLVIQIEEGFEVVYLSQGHVAYEISAEVLEQVYNKVLGAL